MDNDNTNLYDAPIEQQCANCLEYQDNEDAYGVALLILAFIGPIIGILIGLFTAKKLIEKK